MPTPHLDALRAAAHAASHTHNHHLFSLLCEPDQRNQLYRELLGHPQVLPFTSRADTKARPATTAPRNTTKPCTCSPSVPTSRRR